MTSLKLFIDPERAAFVDARARLIILRAVNCGGLSKQPPFLPVALTEPVTQEALRAQYEVLLGALTRHGFNAVRLPFMWEAVEPERGVYDLEHLARMELFCDVASAHGVRVILDCHQDIYSRALGGSGAPGWSLPEQDRAAHTPPRRHWFMAYMADDRVARAFDEFWANREGRLDAFEQMWRVVLERLGAHEAVVGFELLNEPGWGSGSPHDFEHTVWLPFCERFAGELLEREESLIFFYGVPGVHALEPWRHERFPTHERMCFAPHFYDPALLVWPAAQLAMTSPARALERLAALSRESGLPLFVGEFGCSSSGPCARQWLAQMLAQMEHHGISGALWEASLGESLWNHEDLNLLEPDASARALLSTHLRPFVRALSGRLEFARWEGCTFEVMWWSAGEQTEIFLCGPTTTPGDWELVADEAQESWDEGRRVLGVRAPAGEPVLLTWRSPREREG